MKETWFDKIVNTYLSTEVRKELTSNFNASNSSRRVPPTITKFEKLFRVLIIII